MLRILPTVVHDVHFEKQLLLKGLQLAPHDLTVLKAVVVQVIIHCKKTVIISFDIFYFTTIIEVFFINLDKKL